MNAPVVQSVRCTDEPRCQTAPTLTRTGIQSRLTLGALFVWLLFGSVTILIGNIALPKIGRLYDLRAFYAAGFLALHSPSQLFNPSIQESIQNAIVTPMPHGVPFYHPAYEAFLYAPLTLFSYHTAYNVYAFFNLLLLGLCYLVAPETASPLLAKIPRSILFFFAFPPFLCVIVGQDSFLFLLLMCLVWKSISSGRDLTAGFLLALGLFKLQIVLPLVLFLAARRGARLLQSFLPAAAIIALLNVCITGFHGTALWIRLMTSAASAFQHSHQEQLFIAVYPGTMPTLDGLLYLCGGRFLPPLVSFTVEIALSLSVFIATLFLVRRSSRLSSAFCAAIAGTLLIAPHLYPYDYVLLLFPILLLTSRLQPLLAALYYIAPFILFAFNGIDSFALLAFVPIAFLVSIATEQALTAASNFEGRFNPAGESIGAIAQS